MSFIDCSRVEVMRSALEVWKETGIPLLREVKGALIPVWYGGGDDIGIYYFIPWFARTGGLSLAYAIHYWDLLITLMGEAVALSGFLFLSHTKMRKLISLVGVTGISVVTWHLGNVYILPFFAFSFFPWIVVFLQSNRHKSLYGYWVLIGVVIAFSGSIRMYSGAALLVAGLTTTFLYTEKIKKAVLCFLLMAAGYSAYSYWFSVIKQKSADASVLLNTHCAHQLYEQQHVFWHSIYAGFGFITNDLGIDYSDSCALLRAKAIDPEIIYCSKEYDDVLKDEVMALCIHHFQFVLRVLFAKAGVLLFYFLKFANLGLLCAFFYRKPWYIEMAYLFALLVSALPGLVTIPLAWYLGGFFTVATFYGVHSIIWALQQGLLEHLRLFFRKIFLQK